MRLVECNAVGFVYHDPLAKEILFVGWIEG